MTYQLKLKAFEGPLDLLYHLIRENEIDIYDIPIHEITDQYMAYLHGMNSLDMEVTSEFLVMAATLMEIKSRMLLPNTNTNSEEEEVEEDPRDELVSKLLEYQRYKRVADELKEKEKTGFNLYFKNQDDLSCYMNHHNEALENLEQNANIDDLKALFETVITQAMKRDALAYRPKPIYVARETYKVSQQITKITRALRSSKGTLSFSLFFKSLECRQEMVVTFLALLEMIHKGMVQVNLLNKQMDAEIKEVT
ncbi:MAG: segregation/condensation protein A [Tindallia sp. MSAO_Bac2]|nr:MAG: segregation/condensation protein A [Tindallia sp. MSAO_Bac2]